jgi:hypothetical protein
MGGDNAWQRLIAFVSTLALRSIERLVAMVGVSVLLEESRETDSGIGGFAVAVVGASGVRPSGAGANWGLDAL